MNRRIPGAPGKGCGGVLAGHDRKRWDALQKERLHVVAGEDDQRVRLGFVQQLAELPHGRNPGVELLGVFLRRPREELRRVHGRHGCNDLSHVSSLSQELGSN